MAEYNPYVAPDTPILAPLQPMAVSGDLFRDGRYLLFPKGAGLPDRCLLCNEPAEGYRLRKTLYWHRRWWYLLIFINIIVYAIVATAIRQSARVEAPFCPRHRARRSYAIGLGWLSSLAAIAMMVVGVAYGLSSVGYAGLILLPICIITGAVVAQTLIPKQINSHFVWLSKVSPDFLADLPDWHTPGISPR